MDEQQALANLGFPAKEQRPLAETSTVTASALDIESVVRDHARFVFKVAYSVLRNTEDAEDAAQETFLRVHRSGDLPNVREIKAWLARIAWRVALDRLRRHPEQSLEPLTEAGFEVRAHDTGAEQALLQQERVDLLHRMMSTLPDDLRHPLALSTVQEMTSAEIAVILGIPEASVRTRLFRARQLLKEKLAVLMEGRNGL